MQSSLLYFIRVLPLLVSIVKAEYAVSAVNKEAPGNFETVVFYDSWVSFICSNSLKDMSREAPVHHFASTQPGAEVFRECISRRDNEHTVYLYH